MYSFRAPRINTRSDEKMVLCGEDDAYQVQNQSSLNTSILLLTDEPDPALGGDKDLADLTRQVNDFFEPKAKKLLEKKRAALTKAGHADIAARSEVTVFLTEKGLQLGYSYALPRKELAPLPRKPLLRRVLGPLYPGRKFWVMPDDDKMAKSVAIQTVNWPWALWAVVLVGALVGTWFAVSAS